MEYQTTSTGEAVAGSASFAEAERYDEPTGWTGWNIFAATIMMIGGGLQAFSGFVALVNDEWVVWTNRGNVYLDITEWGWVHLIMGAIVFLAGLGVLSGNILARSIGVVLASFSLIANFLYLPVYPIWAISIMILDVLVIWALTVHGGEMRAFRR